MGRDDDFCWEFGKIRKNSHLIEPEKLCIHSDCAENHLPK